MAKELKRPLPQEPDIKLYEHLSEKERMLAGFPYKAFGKGLSEERATARRLVKKYNENDDAKVRQEIMDQLLNPACRGKKILVESPFHVDYGYNLTFGDNFQANYGCVFLDCATITIGDNCLLAPSVHIYAATHTIDPKHRKDDDEYYELAYPVKIGDNVWIGGEAIIGPGVTIGDNCVIGAGAVVMKDVPANSVVGGNPAKIIRQF